MITVASTTRQGPILPGFDAVLENIGPARVTDGTSAVQLARRLLAIRTSTRLRGFSRAETAALKLTLKQQWPRGTAALIDVAFRRRSRLEAVIAEAAKLECKRA